MIDVTSRTCTGCRTCEMLCPARCIHMVPDAEGFLVAQADKNSCVGCGICKSRCPEHMDLFHKDGTQISYALRWTRDTTTIERSASGGAFPALALPVLKRGGMVFGAAFDDDLVVRHIAITSVSELWRLQGSKYVQSDTQDTFREAKEALIEGKEVLYSGTPCQIAGLKSYLGEEWSRLYTVDVVCHGIPSPLMFAKYLEWARRRYGRIEQYVFRSKRFGWGLVMHIRGKKRSAYVSSNDPFNHAYMWGMDFRERCYGCTYARMERVSDVSLFDCWGIQRTHPEFFAKEGVSGVLVNTERGHQLLQDATNYAEVLVPEGDEIIARVGNLHAPSHRPAERDSIYSGIQELDGVTYTERNLLNKVTVVDKAKGLLPYRLKYSLRRLLRKF